MPFSVVVSLCLLLLTTVATAAAAGQWCHWLRWECEKSAILCRPVRHRDCCSQPAEADCGTDSKQALYNSQSQTYDPPFLCNMTSNASCISQYAQYPSSATEPLWCAWTYWTAWRTLLTGKESNACAASETIVRQHNRSRQRVCDCPPPLLPSVVQCNATADEFDNATTAVTSFDAAGVLWLTQTVHIVDEETSPFSDCTNASWNWALVTPLLALALIVAVCIVAGLVLGRLYALRVLSIRQRTAVEVEPSSASVSTASNSFGDSERKSARTLSTALTPDGTDAAAGVSSVSADREACRADVRPGRRVFVDSLYAVRQTPLYANSIQWARPYANLVRLTPIYSGVDPQQPRPEI